MITAESEVTEISSRSNDERVFLVIAGTEERIFGGDTVKLIRNRRHEIIKAIGIMPNDPLPADPCLLAKTWRVLPEQWKQEHRNANEFEVTIGYK